MRRSKHIIYAYFVVRGFCMQTKRERLTSTSAQMCLCVRARAILVSCMSMHVGSILFRFDVELRYTGRDRRLLRATQGFEKKAGWDRNLCFQAYSLAFGTIGSNRVTNMSGSPSCSNFDVSYEGEAGFGFSYRPRCWCLHANSQP